MIQILYLQHVWELGFSLYDCSMTISSWSLCVAFVTTLGFFALAFVFGKPRNSFRVVVNVRISSITQHIPEGRFD
jgi:hypothetical protein